jgi:hypothetical protein
LAGWRRRCDDEAVVADIGGGLVASGVFEIGVAIRVQRGEL